MPVPPSMATHYADNLGDRVACGAGVAGPAPGMTWTDVKDAFLKSPSAFTCPNCIGVLQTRAAGVPEVKFEPDSPKTPLEPYLDDTDLLCKDA